ncbi:MAG: DNA-binding protein [Bacillota bacterium]|nr:DNA-binding protein [Bacillota bacterium]
METGRKHLTKHNESHNIPLFKTIEVMSRISGLGENKLRQMIGNNEVDYIENGNRKLLVDAALWDWYERNKISVHFDQ